VLAGALEPAADEAEAPELVADWGAIGVQAFDVHVEPPPLTYVWGPPKVKATT
jgi:hypothetical protein